MAKQTAHISTASGSTKDLQHGQIAADLVCFEVKAYRNGKQEETGMQAVKFVEHILTIVLRAVRAILLSIPITGIVVGSIIEAIGFITSQHFTALTHIVAAAFAIVMAYAVALTYATVECVLGAVRVAEILEKDFAKQESLLATGLKTLEKTLTRL